VSALAKRSGEEYNRFWATRVGKRCFWPEGGEEVGSMRPNRARPDAKEAVSLLSEVVREARLIWYLLTDGRVSSWVKMIPFATLLYILSPIDFLPDPILGLGQLDDLAALIVGVKLFIEMCPQEIVREYLERMTSMAGSYRVVEEEKAPPSLKGE
jgi:uncharacterized membrane protein YkvA (DUF1232 family)